MCTMFRLALLSILCSLVAVVTSEKLEYYSMQDVCNGNTAPFLALSQVTRLYTNVNLRDVSKCGGKAIATQNVQGVAHANKKRQLCSSLVAGNIYDAFFVHSPLNLFQPLPGVIRDFTDLLAYGIVATCKINFPFSARKLDQTMDKRYLQAIKRLEQADAFLLDSSLELQNSDLIQLAISFKGYMNHGNMRSDDFSDQLKPNTIKVLKHFDGMCVNTFKPILSELIGAIEGLRSMSFDYSVMGPLLTDHRARLTKSASVRRWLNVYIMCWFTDKSYNFGSNLPDPEEQPKGIRTRKMPDMLQVKNRHERDSVIALSSKSDDEIKQVIANIYIKFNGDKLSFRDKMFGKSPSKFWVNYMKYLDSKLGHLDLKQKPEANELPEPDLDAELFKGVELDEPDDDDDKLEHFNFRRSG